MPLLAIGLVFCVHLEHLAASRQEAPASVSKMSFTSSSKPRGWIPIDIAL